MDMDITCWWCEAVLPDLAGLPIPEHDCPSKKMSREAQLMVYVLPGATFCDHYCCGMTENMCLATRLATELIKNGWTPPDRKTQDPQQESLWRD